MKFSAVSAAIAALATVTLAESIDSENENRPSLTRRDAALFEEAAKLTSFNPSSVKPNTEIDIISTLGDLAVFNKRFDRQIRAENVGGQHILIHHPTTSHVGTLAGEALDYAQRKLQSGPYGANETEIDGVLEARQGSCAHRVCVIIAQCGDNCALCYPVFCI